MSRIELKTSSNPESVSHKKWVKISFGFVFTSSNFDFIYRNPSSYTFAAVKILSVTECTFWRIVISKSVVIVASLLYDTVELRPFAVSLNYRSSTSNIYNNAQISERILEIAVITVLTWCYIFSKAYCEWDTLNQLRKLIFFCEKYNKIWILKPLRITKVLFKNEYRNYTKVAASFCELLRRKMLTLLVKIGQNFTWKKVRSWWR